MSYCICAKKLRKNIEKSARKIWSVRKNAYLCNPKRKERYFTELQVRKKSGAIAQLVEQRTEKPTFEGKLAGTLPDKTLTAALLIIAGTGTRKERIAPHEIGRLGKEHRHH